MFSPLCTMIRRERISGLFKLNHDGVGRGKGNSFLPRYNCSSSPTQTFAVIFLFLIVLMRMKRQVFIWRDVCRRNALKPYSWIFPKVRKIQTRNPRLGSTGLFLQASDEIILQNSLTWKGLTMIIESNSWTNGPYRDWSHNLGIISTLL